MAYSSQNCMPSSSTKSFSRSWRRTTNGTGEAIGWLECDSSGFWLEELTNVALRLILLYVYIEGEAEDYKTLRLVFCTNNVP